MYRQIVTNYTLSTTNLSHYLWTYTPHLELSNTWEKASIGKDGSYTLPAPSGVSSQLYEIHIEYSANAVLPLTNNLPKYLIKLSGSGNSYDISLPPYEHTWEFPVSYFEQNGPIHLSPRTDGLLPGKLKIKNMLYRPVSISKQNFQIFEEDNCFKYSPGDSGKWRTTTACKAFTTEHNIRAY